MRIPTATQIESIFKRIDTLLSVDPSDESTWCDIDMAINCLAEMNIGAPKAERFCTIGSKVGIQQKDIDKDLKCLGNGHYAEREDLTGGKLVIDKDRIYYHEGGARCYMEVLIADAQGEPTLKSMKPVAELIELMYMGSTISVLKKDWKTMGRDGKQLVSDKNGAYCGFIKHEASGLWFNKGLARYHSQSGREDLRGKGVFGIGFEVEKVSSANRDKVHSDLLLQQCKWVAESDSSLGDSGYELISPIYNLMSRKLITKDCEFLKDLMKTTRLNSKCGGHINVSKKGLTSAELLDTIRGYASLFYAMDENRMHAEYSRVRKFIDYKESATKYNCFNVSNSQRLEIRIFSEVESAEHLLKRYEFIRHVLTNPTKRTETVAAKLLDPSSPLHNLVKDLNKDPIKMAAKMIVHSEAIDNERFTAMIHTQFKAHGIKFSKGRRTTKVERKSLRKALANWMGLMPEELINLSDRDTIINSVQSRISQEDA